MNKQQTDFIKTWRDDILRLIENMPKDTATFIACQFALESNFGTSSLAVDFNNYCGMKKALVRPTTSRKINGKEFAQYANSFECLVDYFLCLSFHRLEYCDFRTIKTFQSAIKNWYCPEKDYLNKIISIYNLFNSHCYE